MELDENQNRDVNLIMYSNRSKDNLKNYLLYFFANKEFCSPCLGLRAQANVFFKPSRHFLCSHLVVEGLPSM